MKKASGMLLTLLVIVGLSGAVAWQNRIDLLVWGAPKVLNITKPVGPNQPTAWPDGPSVAKNPPEERPPNIILILADDMGFNDISFYNGGAGDGRLQTPSIDAIAREGVVFTNGYAANAVCAPSRATLLTGRYSTRFGFEFTPVFKVGPRIFQWMEELEPGPLPMYIDLETADSLPDMSEMGMPKDEITIAEVLKDKGYYTAHIGKWHLGATGGMRPEDQGFDDSLYMTGMFYLPKDSPDVVNAKREEDGVERMVWAAAQYAAQFNGGETFEPDGYLTDYYTDEAIKVIEKNRNQPFFLYLAHWAVHNPLQALKSDYDALSDIEDHTLRVYSAMIRALDRSVGRIGEALEANGLSDNTLVIFTSDNGGAGYIGLPDINKPYRGWKITHFEGGFHVPYMAKWPAQVAAGSEMSSPIQHIDMFHTIAAAAGADVPTDRKLDGVNLLPYIRGEIEGKPHETLFWLQGHHQAVLHNDWKLIRADLPGKRWLFNLADDPTEQNNVAEEYPEEVAKLEALLDAHRAEQAEPMWPSAINAPQLIDKTGIETYEEGDDYIYWPN